MSTNNPDVVEVISAAQHDTEWIDHEVGFECACNEHGTCEPLPTMSEVRQHQTKAILAALYDAGWAVVPAGDVSALPSPPEPVTNYWGCECGDVEGRAKEMSSVQTIADGRTQPGGTAEPTVATIMMEAARKHQAHDEGTGFACWGCDWTWHRSDTGWFWHAEHVVTQQRDLLAAAGLLRPEPENTETKVV